jgi:hypothetical protein
MKRALSRKVAVVAVLGVLATALAIALVSAGGSRHSAGTRARAARATLVSDTQPAHRGERTARRTVSVAAGYLGISKARLRAELREGKSLAQIAKETGKSEAGLVAALEAAQDQPLDRAAKRLDGRVLREVHTPGASVRRTRLRALRAAALSYLGLTGAQLRAEERSGQTLAQIAQSTPGKSESGLIEAIRNAREQQLAQAVRAGALSPSQEAKSLTRLQQRISALVHRAPGAARGRRSKLSTSSAS